MIDQREAAAVVALLTRAARPAHQYSELVEGAGSALAVLDQEISQDDCGQTSLLVPDADRLLDSAAAEIRHWSAAGIETLTVLDPRYPQNLRAVHDRPPLIFVAGQLESRDQRSIAVIGSRRASAEGKRRAEQIAEHLVHAGFTVISGLAAGIDTAAHTAAIDNRGRTVAVTGTGLNHAYPPANAELQRRIATQGAVVSQFLPDTPPKRENFPARNAVMSGLSLATVIAEASHTSGARIQARQALTHGRPVFVSRPLLGQRWAQELAARPGVYVIDSPAEITTAIARLHDSDVLIW